MKDLEAFARLVGALEPWKSQLVIVGGWAHRLSRHHHLADQIDYQPLTTLDADLAFGSDARLQGNIKSALDDAGFKEELSGQHHPPVSQYTLGDEGAGFYAEFLTTLHGSGMKRNGAANATTVAAGVSAQKLRNLGILLNHPWRVSVGPGQGFPLPQPMELQIANPAGFIVQKFLIQGDRRPEKRAQDMLYVHDTLVLFGAQLPVLASLWRDKLRPSLTERQLRTIEDCRQANFRAVSDTLRAAARIPQDRVLDAERMRAFCQQALDEILA